MGHAAKIYGLLALLTVIACAADVPIAFVSSHSPHAYLIKAQIEPQNEFKIFSKKLRPFGSHWTTVNSQGQKAIFTPSLDSQSLLFNDKHEGRYHIAYYRKVDSEGKAHGNRHFHPVNVQFEGGSYYFLLPLFSQDLPALRTDRLYRCSNVLLAVEWRNGDSNIVVLSEHDPWRIHESIDNGFVHEERGVHYAKLVDEGHTHPIKVEVGNRKHCFISQKTRPAVIEVDVSREFYDLDTILDLVGDSLPIEGDIREQEL